MQVVKGLENLGGSVQNSYVTLGNFDGLHLGHRKIIGELIKRSKTQGGSSIVITFDPHPRKILVPDSKLELMTSMEHRLRLLAEFGVDLTLILRFDEALANVRAESFIRDMLFPKLRFIEIIVGKSYAFGKNREGNVDLLNRLSRELGFKVDFVEPVKIEEQVVSSSFLRRLIKEGRLAQVAQLLGRPFSVLGKVEHGRGIGGKIGFRTANLVLENIVLPPRGVYAVEVILNKVKYAGAANLGVRPTFGKDQKDELEVHILDFHEDIYGAQLEVVFVERIREEKFFESAEGLQGQIKQDLEQIRSKFLTT